MRLPAVFFLAALLAACATKPIGEELVVVLPGHDGKVGGVVVRSEGGKENLLDSAWSANRIRTDGKPEAMRMSQADVHNSFASTIESLPGKPASFLLYFLEGKDEFTTESRAELEKVFSELKRRPAPDIFVIGHTDTVGGLTYNDKLSLARAERVREMLVALGLRAERIQAAGRGKRELLVNTDDNVSEPRNRRVEINVR
jgi:outer membrane protein OmpA-like peptidoglycan-associated protein